jgi:hypothetical protein
MFQATLLFAIKELPVFWQVKRKAVSTSEKGLNPSLADALHSTSLINHAQGSLLP